MVIRQLSISARGGGLTSGGVGAVDGDAAEDDESGVVAEGESEVGSGETGVILP